MLGRGGFLQKISALSLSMKEIYENGKCARLVALRPTYDDFYLGLCTSRALAYCHRSFFSLFLISFFEYVPSATARATVSSTDIT
jgi:hypothetical protein